MTSSTEPDRTQEEQPRRGVFAAPFFWVILGMLLGGLLFALFLFLRPAAPPAIVGVTLPDEYREIQKARLQSLETERDRLAALLREDPCKIPELLGLPPQQAVPDPTYATPPQSGGDVGMGAGDAGMGGGNGTRRGNGTAPVRSLPPAGNGTIPGSGVAPKAAAAPATVATLMDEATVFIISLRHDGVGTGTGFLVAPGVVATNRHVVGEAGAQMFVGNKSLGGMVPARVIAASSEENRDYALLRIADAAAAKVPVLQITATAKRTERVSAWGFPAFITSSDPKLKALLKGDVASTPDVVYSEGVVSVVLDRKPPFIVHTAPLSQGNSGGPLINEKGLVVGINTMITMAVKDSYSQSGVALPGEDLVRFIRENGINVPLAGQ